MNMQKTNAKKCSCACGCEQEGLQSPADAVMAVAILAVSADGKLDKREINDLESVLASSPLFDEVENAREYMGCIAAAIQGLGRPEILRTAAKLLSPSLRETAYAWAVYMISSDRKMVKPEHKFLSVLRKDFGLHGVLAGKINAVVPMLNRVK
ncbi:MAG: hypothetical protein A2016_11735 [Elusimicrobia bacterium GWF2_62_30]|nr:MAG: hypothetical protein A2016_11735 [Elusimicrobia bacterium GWF2_62_30]